jgi:antitoxin component YwqK of YwqJK toxin-antitoxin module
MASLIRLKSLILIAIALLTCAPLFAQQNDLGYRDGYCYKNDMLYTGISIIYFKDSTIQMEMKVRSGLQVGITRVFHPNGFRKEQRYHNEGDMDSLWINSNGKEVNLGEARYKNGWSDGFRYLWGDNGVKRYEMFYRKGKEAGIRYIWDEKGGRIAEISMMIDPAGCCYLYF